MNLFSGKFLVTGCLALVLVIIISYSSIHYSNASVNDGNVTQTFGNSNFVNTSLQRDAISFGGFSNQTQTPSMQNYNIASGGPLTPSEFLSRGGKSIIMITPSETLVNASRGSTIKVTFTLTHTGSNSQLSNVTIAAEGIANEYIPPSVINATTPQERADAIRNTGKPIQGTLDLNSLVTFSPQQLSLQPNASKQVDLFITIPQNWPQDVVNHKVWFSVLFGEGAKYDYHDLLIVQTGIYIHIVR